MTIQPGDVIARAESGDPEILFALHAAAEQHERETERWNTLYEMIKQHAEALAG